MRLGFTKSVVESNLYYKVVEEESLILVLYVDDLFLIGVEKLIEWCKKQLVSEFEMKVLGLMHYFLGLDVCKRANEIFLSQGRYTVDILRTFGMMHCKSMDTPMTMNLNNLGSDVANSDLIDPTMYRQLVGSLMYLVNTKPDICFAVSTLCQFMSQPRQMNWVAAKHVLTYLCGTIGYGLRYTSNSEMRLFCLFKF